MVAHHDEAQLIQRAQAGDKEAFAILHNRHWKAIFNYIYYRVNSQSEAEDLTADVFVRLVEKINRYQDRGKPILAWLYTIARNIVIDHIRTNDKVPEFVPMDEHISTGLGDPSHATDQQLAADCLQLALRRLTELQQQVIVGKFIEGRTNQDLAKIFDNTVGAIKSLQHRALASLRRAIEQEGCYEPGS